MSVRGISAVWQYSKFGGGTLLTLLAIGDQVDETGLAWPSELTLAARARLSVRQVQRALVVLVDAGELEIWTWTSPSTKNERNAYRIILGDLAGYKGHLPDALFQRHVGARVRRRKLSKTKREHVFERDGFRCQWCKTTETLEIDHIVAVANGGSDEDANLQVLCRSCNRKKGAGDNLSAQSMANMSPRGATPTSPESLSELEEEISTKDSPDNFGQYGHLAREHREREERDSHALTADENLEQLRKLRSETGL